VGSGKAKTKVKIRIYLTATGILMEGDFTHSPCHPVLPFFRHMKQGLASVLKAIAGIAAVVCLLTPVAGMGILVFVIALIVAIIAGVIGSHLSGDDDQGGYWPKDPNSSGSKSA